MVAAMSGLLWLTSFSKCRRRKKTSAEAIQPNLTVFVNIEELSCRPFYQFFKCSLRLSACYKLSTRGAILKLLSCVAVNCLVDNRIYFHATEWL